ncbi:MAG TPA: HXXEE domain-containing protein [Acidobacteriaceae bacterium]|nr:HXXEE domain-containing protein [Acidobacteriaceae bacterium]
MPHWTFGLAWVGFAVAIALHVADEATHDFLGVYNPNARAIRQRFHLPIPVFSFRGFIVALSSAVALLLILSPFAFRGAHWLRVLAIPVAILAGIGNGCLHLGGSALYRRWMPGVLTAPLLLVAGSWLLWSTCQ